MKNDAVEKERNQRGWLDVSKRMVLVVVVMLVVTMVGFVSLINILVKNSQLANIEELADHDVLNISTYLLDCWDELSRVSVRLRNGEYKTLQEVQQFLLAEEKNGTFGRLYLVDSDYRMYGSERVYMARSAIYKNFYSSSERFITSYDITYYLKPEFQNQNVFFGFPMKPFDAAGLTFINIISENKISHVKSRLRLDSYDGQAFSTVINSDGYILTSNSGAGDRNNFFAELRRGKVKGMTAERVVERIESQEKFAIDFESSTGDAYSMIFKPIGDTRWTFVMKVPQTVFSRQSFFISLLSFSMMLVCLGVVLVLLMRIMNVSQREREKARELETQRERQKSLELIAMQKEELEVQKVALEDAVKQVEFANKAKSSFLFNMSHDIRTPMNAVIGFTGIAKKYIDNKEKVLDCLNKVDISSNYLLKLINDVLDMARVESGKVTIKEERVSLEEIAQNLILLVKQSVGSKMHEVALHCENLVNPYVYADRLHVNQVVLNILSNAVKYTKDGGKISLTLRQAPSKKEKFGKYCFIVEDNGIGMDSEMLSHVYDSFYRVESATRSGIQGTGLGMAIAKLLVEQMGGTIELESELGVGTKATLTFEFLIAESFATESVVETVSERQVDFSGMRVLLVEDNELNREIAVDLLEELGLLVDEACDGSEAVKIVEGHAPNYYSFVLMDIQMPVMDGYTATKKIRALDDAFRDLPIIAMTANAFEEDKRKALAFGMNAHVSKPIDRVQLVQILTEYVNRLASRQG